MRFPEGGGIRFDPGDVVGMANLRQRQTNPGERPPQLHIHEITQRAECDIFLATKLSHDVRVYKGVVNAPEKLSCWVMLPGEPLQVYAALTKAMLGDALAIEVRPPLRDVFRTPILNWDPMVWADGKGKKAGRDALLQRAAWAIDVYHHWRANQGALPDWFKIKKSLGRGLS